jgi:hypothetical protein
MAVCALFWLLAIPLIVSLWRTPYVEVFSRDERLLGTILLFLPVFGVVFWGLYFQKPTSKHPRHIFPGPEDWGFGGVSRAKWTMAETARQNATSLSQEAHVPKGVRRAWRFLRWPFFASLVVVVVWFNSLLIG